MGRQGRRGKAQIFSSVKENVSSAWRYRRSLLALCKRKGQCKKTEESVHQQTIDRYRHNYETRAKLPLHVQILGTINDQLMDGLVQALLEPEIAAMDLGEQTTLQLDASFKAHVTKAFRGEWFLVSDRVGFVNRKPLPVIQRQVAKKARKLNQYKAAVGSDVRLLLVADRLYQSGKLRLVEEASINTHGFRAVYFFSHPESVHTFACGAPAASSPSAESAAGS